MPSTIVGLLFGNLLKLGKASCNLMRDAITKKEYIQLLTTEHQLRLNVQRKLLKVVSVQVRKDENMLKFLLKSDFEKYHIFTSKLSAFQSDVAQTLLVNISAKGGGSSTNAMCIIFAFQIYGKFLSKIGQIHPLSFIFFAIESHVTLFQALSSYFDAFLKYSVQYKTVNHSVGSGGVPHDCGQPEISFHRRIQ